jgi:hypothetical protein
LHNIRISTLNKNIAMNKNLDTNRSGTDWKRLAAMADEEIDFSDCPEVTAEMWKRAIVRKGLVPKPIKPIKE